MPKLRAPTNNNLLNVVILVHSTEKVLSAYSDYRKTQVCKAKPMLCAL